MDQERRRQLAAKGRRLYDRFCRKDDYACVLGFVDHQLLQAQDNVVDDLLAFLAEQRVAMRAEHRQRSAAFWRDLAGVAAAGEFDALRNGRVRESSLWQAEACRPYVSAASRATRTLDEALVWSEAAFTAFVRQLVGGGESLGGIVAVYRRHAPALGELVDRVRRTERLADRIIARRRGLTGAES